MCNWIIQSNVPSLSTGVTEKLLIFGMDGNFAADPVIDLINILPKCVYTSQLRETVPSVQGFKYIVEQKYVTEVY